MTTFPLVQFCPQVASRLFWIKANRVLAWSLIMSPLVQWALGMAFVTGLLIDLAILAVHGVLSLVLFGKPETRARTWSLTMHAMGFKSGAMSDRNRFLLTGYRIGLAVIAMALMYWSGSYTAFALLMLCFYPLMRLPITIVQHMFGAVVYALRRWRVERGNAAAVAAVLIIVYVLVSFFNMAR